MPICSCANWLSMHGCTSPTKVGQSVESILFHLSIIDLKRHLFKIRIILSKRDVLKELCYFTGK